MKCDVDVLFRIEDLLEKHGVRRGGLAMELAVMVHEMYDTEEIGLEVDV